MIATQRHLHQTVADDDEPVVVGLRDFLAGSVSGYPDLVVDGGGSHQFAEPVLGGGVERWRAARAAHANKRDAMHSWQAIGHGDHFVVAAGADRRRVTRKMAVRAAGRHRAEAASLGAAVSRVRG